MDNLPFLAKHAPFFHQQELERPWIQIIGDRGHTREYPIHFMSVQRPEEVSDNLIIADAIRKEKYKSFAILTSTL